LRSWQAGHSTLHPRLPWAVCIHRTRLCMLCGRSFGCCRPACRRGWMCLGLRCCLRSSRSRTCIHRVPTRVCRTPGGCVESGSANAGRAQASMWFHWIAGYICTPCIHDQRTMANRQPGRSFFFFCALFSSPIRHPSRSPGAQIFRIYPRTRLSAIRVRGLGV
jgi:hypothetical protein